MFSAQMPSTTGLYILQNLILISLLSITFIARPVYNFPGMNKVFPLTLLLYSLFRSCVLRAGGLEFSLSVTSQADWTPPHRNLRSSAMILCLQTRTSKMQLFCFWLIFLNGLFFAGHVPTAVPDLLYTWCAQPRQYLPTRIMFVIVLRSQETSVIMLFAKPSCFELCVYLSCTYFVKK